MHFFTLLSCLGKRLLRRRAIAVPLSRDSKSSKKRKKKLKYLDRRFFYFTYFLVDATMNGLEDSANRTVFFPSLNVFNNDVCIDE